MNIHERLLLSFLDFLLKPFVNKFLTQINQNPKIEKLVNLYPEDKFIKIRFWDAPYIEVEKIVPKKGITLDLGCGEGLFANFLASTSKERQVFGLDIDKRRILKANRGFKNTRFVWGDVTKKEIPKADTIIMFHLLHHLPSFKAQEELIKKIKTKLKRKGKLIIVEVEPKLSYKYFIAWFTDHFLVPWLFEKRLYSEIFFRSSKEWERILKENGFKTKISSAEKGMPFSHVIIDCIKI